MGCGCKKKHEVPAQQPTQQPAQIKFTETPRPPEPIQPPQDVENIVEKLNSILTP